MAVFRSQSLDPRSVACLCRVAQADIRGAPLIRYNECGYRAGGWLRPAVPGGRELPCQHLAIGRLELFGPESRQWNPRTFLFPNPTLPFFVLLLQKTRVAKRKTLFAP